jgi:hypothetical protein
MLHGCGCDVVGNSKYFMTFTEMSLFWLFLSTMKFNDIPFTHIHEWKRRSPSLGYVGASGWIVVVVTMEVGSALRSIFFHYFIN